MIADVRSMRPIAVNTAAQAPERRSPGGRKCICKCKQMSSHE